jgi:hypothetical protein
MTDTPEPLVTAFAAALKALRHLHHDGPHPAVPIQIDQATNALTHVGTNGAAAVTHLLTEIGACHQQGRPNSTELEDAFRAAYLLIAHGPPMSWG